MSAVIRTPAARAASIRAMAASILPTDQPAALK
jgi:hypothetical protein